MKLNNTFFLIFFTTSLIASEGIGTKFNYFGNLSASKLNTAGYNLNDYSHTSVDNKWNLAPYSKAGAQLSVYSELFTFTAQALMRKVHEDYEAELTWLNVKFDINDNFALRLGRIQTKVLLQSESLDIDYLQLWAKAPVEVYRLMPVRTYDGLELSYDNNFAEYHLNISVVGFASFSDTINGSKNTQINLDLDNSHSLTLSLKNDMFTYKASYSSTKADIQDDVSTQIIVNALAAYANDVERFRYEDREINVYSLGFEYRNNEFTLDTEIVRSDSNGLLPSSSAAYLMLGYQINKFTPYVIYAKNKNDKSYYDTSAIQVVDATSRALKRGLDDILYLNNYSQETASIGVRYDIKAGMALNMQVDRISSTNYGSISPSTVQSTGYEKIGVLSRDAGISNESIFAYTLSLNFAY